MAKAKSVTYGLLNIFAVPRGTLSENVARRERASVHVTHKPCYAPAHCSGAGFVALWLSRFSSLCCENMLLHTLQLGIYARKQSEKITNH